MSPVSSAPRPAGAARPVQDRAAREVPAAADQREAVAEVLALALPQLDHGVGLHDPLGVVGVQVHRAAEAPAPVDHRRVVVGVGDRDRARARRAARPPRRCRRRAASRSPTAAAARPRARAARAGRSRTSARSRSRSARPRGRCGWRGPRAAPRASSTAARSRARTGARPRRSGSSAAASRSPRTGPRRSCTRSGSWHQHRLALGCPRLERFMRGGGLGEREAPADERDEPARRRLRERARLELAQAAGPAQRARDRPRRR